MSNLLTGEHDYKYPFRFSRGHHEKPETVLPPEQWVDEATRSQRSIVEVWRSQLRSHSAMLVASMRAMARDTCCRFWDGKCPYCRKDITAEDATLDHVIPRHDNGSDDLCNFIVACRDCNSKRGHQSCEEYLRSLEWPDEEILNFRARLAEWADFCKLEPMSRQEREARMRMIEDAGIVKSVYARFGFDGSHYF